MSRPRNGILLGLACLACALAVHSQIQSRGKTTAAVLGVRSTGIDSAYGDALRRELTRLLGASGSVALYDVRKNSSERLDELLSAGRDSLPVPQIAALPAMKDIRYGIAVEVRSGGGRVVHFPSLVDFAGGVMLPMDSLAFVPEILNRQDVAAARLATRFLVRMGTDSARPVALPKTILRKPIPRSQLVRDLEIVQQDSVRFLLPGAGLVTSDLPAPHPLELGRLRFLLHPYTSVVWHGSGVMELLSGELSVVSLGDTAQLLTPCIRLRAASGFLSLSHARHASRVWVLEGTSEVYPLLGSGGTEVPPLHTASSRGYLVDLSPLQADEAIARLEGLWEHLPATVGKTVQKEAERKNLERLSQTLAEKRRDRMLRSVIATGFDGAGIDASAFWAEEDVWQFPDRHMGTVLHESGCYLRSPDRFGP